MFKKIAGVTNARKVYPGLKNIKNVKDIPGLSRAAWEPDAEYLVSRPSPRQKSPLYLYMKKIVQQMGENTHSWPFVEPVAGVPDYYLVIKQPMDLRTIDENIEAGKYNTLKEFKDDISLIWTNCRLYNEDGSTYVKCANKLEKWYKEKSKILQIEMAIVD